jgi:hypothetical protein
MRIKDDELENVARTTLLAMHCGRVPPRTFTPQRQAMIRAV